MKIVQPPISYPGGKQKLVTELLEFIPKVPVVVSPFFGGGSVELNLCQRGSSVVGYDIDACLVSFWQAQIAAKEQLFERVNDYYPLSAQACDVLRASMRQMAPGLDRAAAFFTVLRTSFSATLTNGGQSPTHTRFTPEIIRQIQMFDTEGFTVEEMDFREAFERHTEEFMFLDPPYVGKEYLYGSGDRPFPHDELHTLLKDRPRWIMTYGDDPHIRELYADFPITEIRASYCINERREEDELVIESREHLPKKSFAVNLQGERCPSNERPRLTLDDWLRVPKENAVALAMDVAKFDLDEIVTGAARVAYLIGAPGVGKTHLVGNACRRWVRRGIEPLVGHARNKHALIKLFIEAGGSRPIILEENDVLFRSSPMMELLKLATDPLAPTHTSQDGSGLPKIPLRAPLVVTSNCDVDRLPSDLHDQAKALFDRQRPVKVPSSAYELWEWVVYLALTTDLLREVTKPYVGHGITGSAFNASLDWFTDNVWRLKAVSARTLKDAAEWFSRVETGRGMTPAIRDAKLAGELRPFARNGDPKPIKPNWLALRKDYLSMRRRKHLNVSNPAAVHTQPIL